MQPGADKHDSESNDLNKAGAFSASATDAYARAEDLSLGEEEDTEFGGEGPDEGGDEGGLFEHHRLTVDPGQGMMRIDVFLSNMLRNASRTKVKKAADAGCLLVNEKQVKASYKIKPGDVIVLLLPYPPPPDLAPQNIPIEIVYEDPHLLLVNKAAGMVVHPGVGNWHGTLVHALLYHFNGPEIKENDETVIWPKLVHRIDKDTSGLLIVAKDDDAMYGLSRQFFEHTTERNYFAIAWGDIKEDRGTITGHVGRHKKDRKKFAVYPDGSVGKHAVTHFEVIERFGIATLVRCKLETGRTHQIRVHMKHIGHTLFGDGFYGGDMVLAGPNNSRSYLDFIFKCLKAMPRQALHARTLGFTHPITQKRMLFESPLPADFETLIGMLRGYREKK